MSLVRMERPIFRDLWHLIYKLILALLVIAWFVEEYLRVKELNLFSLIILLIILALIILLILRQRQPIVLLRCSLTAPSNCVKGDPNILSGMVLEPVMGGAYGLGFSHYLIEVRDPDSNLLSNVIVYPDGGGNPDPSISQGNIPISSGTLGWIDVEKAVTDAGIRLLTSTTFEVRLRVFGVDGSELIPPCTTNFDVSVNEVYIKRVSTPWSVNFVDPDEPLRKGEDATSQLATIGGTMHVRGAANVYGCAGENIKEYTIWAIPDPNFTFVQPAPLTSVTPQHDWNQVAHIEFTDQTLDSTTYLADDVRAYNVLDGDPEPDILTNNWGVRYEGICASVDFKLTCNFWKVPDLKASIYNSNVLGTGKFTFLLQVKDTSGNQYYDIQRAWIDNEHEVAKITGIAGLQKCQDLYTKDSTGAFKIINIEGTAWDPLIDPSDLSSPTSDNFDRYEITFEKQGAATEEEIHKSISPVPPRPNPIDVGLLAKWNLEELDATANPKGHPSDQLLKDGESCPYVIHLRVYDLTIFNESNPSVHFAWAIFPIKIINSPEPSP